MHSETRQMDILLPRFNWPCTSLPWWKHLEQSLKENNPRADFFKFRHESIALAHFYNNLTDQKSKQFPPHGKRNPLCETAILQDTQFARLRRGATATMLSAPPSHHPALQSHNWSKWLSLETLTKGASQWILDLRTFSAHELSCPSVDMFGNDRFSPSMQLANQPHLSRKQYLAQPIPTWSILQCHVSSVS